MRVHVLVDSGCFVLSGFGSEALWGVVGGAFA